MKKIMRLIARAARALVRQFISIAKGTVAGVKDVAVSTRDLIAFGSLTACEITQILLMTLGVITGVDLVLFWLRGGIKAALVLAASLITIRECQGFFFPAHAATQFYALLGGLIKLLPFTGLLVFFFARPDFGVYFLVALVFISQVYFKIKTHKTAEAPCPA